MPITSNFNTANEINQFAALVTLVTPTRDMIASMFAEPYTTPYNRGAQLLLTRFQQLPPVLTPTGGGAQPPPPYQLIRDVIPIVNQRYCVSVALDTQLLMQDQLPWVQSAAERNAVALRLGQDINTYNAIISSASIYRCKYGVNGDDPTEPTKLDFLEVTAALNFNSAAYVTEFIPGNDMFGTVPLNQCFFGLINPTINPIIYQIPGFQSAGAYPLRDENRSPSEFGSLDFLRFWQSANVPVLPQASTLGNDVAITIIGGAKPYATSFLDSDSIETYIRDPMYSNANATITTVGCNLYFGSAVTQNTWIVQVWATGNSNPVF